MARRRGSWFHRLLGLPEPPANYPLYRTEIPLSERLWRAIAPPKPAPRAGKPLNRPQRLLIRGSLAALFLAAVGWAVYTYISSAPGRSEARLEEGMALLRPGDYESAAEVFGDAIEIWDRNARAYLERGNAYSSLGRNQEALADWSKAIELDPLLQEAYTARGTLHRVKGDLAAALADIDQSLALGPDVNAFYQRGQVLSALGRYQEAIDDYTRAIEQRPDSPYVYRARAIARRETGDLEGFQEDSATADLIQSRF